MKNKIGVLRTWYTVMIVALLSSFAMSQQGRNELAPDPNIPIPKVKFDAAGNLVVAASATSSNRDFDFLVGKWKMHHRRLDKRLANWDKWTEFDSFDENHSILANTVNMDRLTTTEMPGLEGKPFEGLTLRLFDAKTRLWRLYWVPSNTGVIDPPVVGSFENGIGHFFAKDVFQGTPVIVLFRWDVRNKDRPIWSQAFSPDNGRTWEWNWFNVSERVR